MKATRTDDEWTAQSRQGLNADAFNKLKSSEEIAKQNADWYRELVGGSGASTPIVDQAGSEAAGSTILVQPVVLSGQGSADAPFTLDDDDDGKSAEPSIDVESSSATKVAVATYSTPLGTASKAQPPPAPTESIVVSGDDTEHGAMYCLLCKALVPAADVPGHTSSILHQLSKDPSFTGKTPLVPPTSYGIRSSNLGYGMLQRLGWAEDTGLGTSMLGRKTPIRATEKFDRKGVGVDSRKKLRLAEDEGKVVKSTREEKVVTARPLAKNRKELERSKKREMLAFQEGLAYLNS